MIYHAVRYQSWHEGWVPNCNPFFLTGQYLVKWILDVSDPRPTVVLSNVMALWVRIKAFLGSI